VAERARVGVGSERGRRGRMYFAAHLDLSARSTEPCRAHTFTSIRTTHQNHIALVIAAIPAHPQKEKPKGRPT